MKDAPLMLWQDSHAGIEWEGPGYYALNQETVRGGVTFMYSRNDVSLYREYWDAQKLIEFIGCEKVADVLVKASRWLLDGFFDEQTKWTFYAAVDQITIPK